LNRLKVVSHIILLFNRKHKTLILLFKKKENFHRPLFQRRTNISKPQPALTKGGSKTPSVLFSCNSSIKIEPKDLVINIRVGHKVCLAALDNSTESSLGFLGLLCNINSRQRLVGSSHLDHATSSLGLNLNVGWSSLDMNAESSSLNQSWLGLTFLNIYEVQALLNKAEGKPYNLIYLSAWFRLFVDIIV
jgi:hypothetical protein